MTYNNTCFGTYLYSAGPYPRQRKGGVRFGTDELEWTGKVETRKEDFSGSGQSMHGYILTYSRH